MDTLPPEILYYYILPHLDITSISSVIQVDTQWRDISFERVLRIFTWAVSHDRISDHFDHFAILTLYMIDHVDTKSDILAQYIVGILSGITLNDVDLDNKLADLVEYIRIHYLHETLWRTISV
jgi:hypothetical protein